MSIEELEDTIKDCQEQIHEIKRKKLLTQLKKWVEYLLYPKIENIKEWLDIPISTRDVKEIIKIEENRNRF